MLEVHHDDPDLARLELEAAFTASFAVPVVKGFRKVMQRLRTVSRKASLYRFGGLKLEQLKGKRKHEHSMRLNNKWRLIVEFEGEEPNEIVRMKGIENHYGD